jgi:aspartyl-tRNA(Asn)/glutamyl-tRNA(Gln) amidotransferase subunit B
MGERPETVIGLEIHAQLKTRTKLFCSCRADQFDAPPNTHTCPVCLGMPGALPVLNRRAVELAIKAALAFHCTIHGRSIFARKNYFYPDLPKGYQISQYDEPLATAGWVELELDGETRRIGIRRVHLEEDAGKLIHGEGRSLVDFNRSGVPLIEIVTEPEIRSPREAKELLREIRRILRYIEVSDGDMEKGELRCDANISLNLGGREGTRTEIKNMNSFRAVEEALSFEESRQREVLLKGGRVEQQTLGWDAERGRAILMRTKEESEDYRYFPEPDLVPLVVDEHWREKLCQELPELPAERRRRWREEYRLPDYDIEVLTEEREIADYFEEVVRLYPEPKEVSNWMMTELLRLVKEDEGIGICPTDFAHVLRLVAEGKINRNTGKELIAESFRTGKSPREIVQEKDLLKISDEGALSAAVAEVIAENPRAVADYRGGREQALGFLLGQLMCKTKGKADPQVARRILLEQLKG